MNNTDKIVRIVYNPKDKLNALIGFIEAHGLPEEDWREVKNSNGDYFISTRGRLLSLKYNLPRLIKLNNVRGYKCVKIKGKNKRVNRLVAEAFIPNPEALPVVHHRDGNKANNSLSNLKWVSYQENTEEYWKQKRKE